MGSEMCIRDRIKGIKALIDDPAARQKLGDALVNDANAKIERIQDALEHGGDERAVQLGQDIGELVWQVGTIATGVGTAAKGGLALAKTGIKVGAEGLEKMADMAKIAKAEASAGKPMNWTSVEGAYSGKLEGGYGPGTTTFNGKVVDNPGEYSVGVKGAGPTLERGLAYDNPSSLIQNRVSEIQSQIPANSQGRITMGVAVVEDANGVRSVLISTSEPRGYLRPGVSLQEGEKIVVGTGHAEADIVNYANANGLKVVDIGATRPVCVSCQNVIEPTGANVSTPLKPPPKVKQ